MILQIIKEDDSFETINFKNIKEIQRYFHDTIPYSALINIYYTCSNKGGGIDKKRQKKHIHGKYIQLLKRLRIFDANNKELMDNKEYFYKILKC